MRKMDFRIATNNKYTVDISEHTENGVSVCKLDFAFDREASPDPISIEWDECARHYHSVYTPCALGSSYLRPEWAPVVVKSGICTNMPFYALLDRSGMCLLALSLDDVILPVELSFGYNEERDCVVGKIELFTSPCSPIKNYSVTVRVDRNRTSLTKACARVVDRWAELGYVNDFVPSAAFDPVYSTWYNFHQELAADKLLAECAIAKKLGVKTLIVDDGWQTDDNGRGYGYCGDWAVAKSKFPDFKGFVKAVHALGMKVMVWFSVPYMGDYAEAYPEFKDMLLCHDAPMHTNVLDPRYKKVRDYLVGVYTRFIETYDIDGLKLDFIDSFKTNGAFFHKDGMDCFSVEDGVSRFLSEVRKAVSALKKDALIEFRQTYCGPVIGAHANMLRVADCPGDAAANLTESLRLRLLSKNVTVHSDMMTCRHADPPEAIAEQLAASLFAVPQLSFMLSALPESHLKVIEFYLGFQKRHARLIFGQTPLVSRADKNVTMVESATEDEKLVCLYADGVVRDGKATKKIYIVNGKGERGTVACLSADYEYKCYDCSGSLVDEGKLAAGCRSLDIPDGGIYELTRVDSTPEPTEI